MKQPQFIIEQQLDVLKIYVSEHGQEMGNVSWRMAKAAINLIEESVSRLVTENEEESASWSFKDIGTQWRPLVYRRVTSQEVPK